MQLGSEGTSGVVTDDSETFRLDTLKAEVEGGACSKRLNLVQNTMERRERLHNASYPIIVH